MESLLVKDVTYSYRNKYQTVHALSGVSVEFKPGKMYAIIGASGCGKTTFLSLLAGLDVPETGSIKWAGEATAGKRFGDLSELQFVPTPYRTGKCRLSAVYEEYAEKSS